MKDALDSYWRTNIRLKAILLTIWAAVSLGLAIILVEPLNNIEVGGFPGGFWVAQQGAIYTFVILIFVYARLMDRRDAELEATLEAELDQSGPSGPDSSGGAAGPSSDETGGDQ